MTATGFALLVWSLIAGYWMTNPIRYQADLPTLFLVGIPRAIGAFLIYVGVVEFLYRVMP